MATNGQPSRSASGVPSWNPAALLQPNHRAVSSPNLANSTQGQFSHPQSPLQQNQRMQQRPQMNMNMHSNSMVFQFSSPNDTPSAGPSSRSSTPGSSYANGFSGAGNFIERVNNVQHRSVVPQPKRRRTEDSENGFHHIMTPQMHGGGGILGQYVTDRRQEANGATASPSMTVDLTEGNDDDEVVMQDPREEEVCYGMIKASLGCTRVPSPKPGTQSVWGPGYQPAIKVVLKRQVGDSSFKIQAYDHTRQIIGLVEAQSARAIAPLLDSNIHLRTDSRIPPQPKKPGEEPGQPTSRSYTLDIVMYGPLKYSRNVGGHLSKFGQKLLAPYLVQKGIRVQNPHVLEYRPPPPRSYPPNPSGDGQNASYGSTFTNRTVEEIRSEVMGVFDSLTRNDDLPEMEPHFNILTPLLKHQKQGLFFMMTREKLREAQAHEKTMVSFWQDKWGPSGQKVYFNVITGQNQAKPPAETRGGILADMMGLGKTLSILSLLTTSTDAAYEWERQAPIQPEVPEQKPTKHEVLSQQPTLALTPVTKNAKTTLLVCPLSTVTNWEEQIKQHVQPGALTYHIYHGPNRIKDPERLATFDLVITTYGSVSNELSARRKRKEGQYPLEQIGWFRIVLDEAHMIREHSTLQFKAICRLQADRRWAVTGTPVQNRLDDLAALLAFLRLHPFHDRTKFLRYIVEPFKACDPEIVPKLRILVDTITLRRLKDKIDLPPREDLVVRLDFSQEERSIYELFAKNAQDRVKVLAGTNNGQALGGNTYIHILKAILRLRLLCAHGKDLLNDADLDALQGMSAEMAIDIDDDEDDDKPVLSDQKAHEMFTLMQETNNDACIECSRKLGSNESSNIEAEGQDDILGFMTPCFHVICRTCIRTFKERVKSMTAPGENSGNCPVCNTYGKHGFVQLHRKEVDAEHDGPAKPKSRNSVKNFDKYDGPHTKTRALIEDLLKSKAASEANPSEPPFKSVVFSGWTSHLDLIELALNANEIVFTRLDGSMSRTQRTTAMDRFREDNTVHVILVSIMAGGLGLNLTAGNSVYVMEPQYNPAAEAQAVDRVHRLGQKRPVRTVRYIMRDSFEEKMLELQEKKMKLASLSMDGQNRSLDKAEAARQKLMDLRSLFK
ncbi:SNF2 family N-terminal domain-containing protein [Fusarium tricinctum]|uniref:SNF2 family N-terminal domain-containing protein n=1 Tax=Fusarium tricinctum TaxID=61284 RepID=A0A8K0RQ07_9HYPO|nr:SNF2 family N-terminal domain-containing protein [Fusarium tricinctum]